MARKVGEWFGKSDNAKAPPRVRQRIYDRDKGVCHLCKLQIKVGETWQADHVIALINGGKNAESNLAPAHSHCHVGKTALDVKEKAKVAKVRAKHTGVQKPSSKLARAKVAKPPLTKSLPPRRLYERIEP
ncbi:MAG: HNH endonuclease signature motif containing protein [Phyllobacterium sp.]|uniref:HNH endonuclease n=1 Tax=Phyllobacterium sp. TaxID=1871046 RepID=UPI0030F0EFC0